MTTTLEHPGLAVLRRALASEPLEAWVTTHLERCPSCRARLVELEAEQRHFEAEVPFETFAAGVDRARRALEAPAPVSAGRNPRRVAGGLAVALAAMAVAVLAGRALRPEDPAPGSRLKGASAARGAVEVVIAAPGSAARRLASEDPGTPEALARGDRLRIGVSPGPWHFVLVLSLDAQGVITPAYASGSRSLPLTGASPEFLPDSLEFTGAGLEHLVILLSDRPLEVDAVSAELARRYAEAGGDLTQVRDIDVPGEQFHRTVLKP